MANETTGKKITALPTNGTPSSSDYILVEDGKETKKATVESVLSSTTFSKLNTSAKI